MNKKAQVKMLLDIMSNLKSIPTTKDNGIDMDKLYEVPEVKSIIILLRYLKVDNEYLSKSGFVVANMLLGRALKKWVEYECRYCGSKNKHLYFGKDTHFCNECGKSQIIK